MLTMDYGNNAGGGAWVLWKGEHVDHFGGGGQTPSEIMANCGADLTKRCEHIESLGMTPRSSNVIWRYSWFEDCPVDSPYLPFLRLMPEVSEREIPSNFEFAFEMRDFVVLYHQGSTTFLEAAREEDYGWYHILRRIGYVTAKWGQQEHNGCCYATYEGIVEWINRHRVDVEAVVNKIQEGIANVKARHGESSGVIYPCSQT